MPFSCVNRDERACGDNDACRSYLEDLQRSGQTTDTVLDGEEKRRGVALSNQRAQLLRGDLVIDGSECFLIVHVFVQGRETMLGDNDRREHRCPSASYLETSEVRGFVGH